jgi:hypothetical protein
MQRELIRNPKLRFSLKTGSEGPAYDPYHYDEYTIQKNDTCLTLHLGLGQWYRWGRDTNKHVTGPDYDKNWWDELVRGVKGGTSR